jgi:hypothetical protein
MRRIAFAGVFVCVLVPAHAGIVKARSGATATVADRAVSTFQCIVDRLEGQGYPVRFLGGYRRHGSVRHSLHPMGLALDINQYARNRTRPRMPSNEIAIANGCGAVSGAQWRHADSGHEQIGGWTGSGHERRRDRIRFASRTRPAEVERQSWLATGG